MLRFPSAADTHRTEAKAGGTAPKGRVRGGVPQWGGPQDRAASSSSKTFCEGGQKAATLAGLLQQLILAFLTQGPVLRLPSPGR